MATKASAKNVTLVRAMRVLDLFREHERLSLPEMAALSGLPKTTVFRMAGAWRRWAFCPATTEERTDWACGFSSLASW